MTKASDILVKRIAEKIKTAQPGGSEQLKLATRIALLLRNQIILNVRSNKLIKTGNLINSIQARVSIVSGGGFSVEAGSFGVPYARIHEYGFSGNESVKAHKRFQSKAFGKLMKNPHEVDVRAHNRFMVIKARPYIRPAFRDLRDRILKIIQDAF